MYSVLQNKNNIKFKFEKFPYVIIDDALPSDLYEELSSSFPKRNKEVTAKESIKKTKKTKGQKGSGLYDYIVNPSTGRRVNINGKIGKNIINNYIYMIGGSQREAIDPYVLNWKPYATLEEKKNHTLPKFKIGDRVVTTDPGFIISDRKPRVEKKSIYYGTIIDIPKNGTLIYDNDLEERYDPEPWNLGPDCECHIDYKDTGSVWFEPDNERKYFVKFDYPEDHIDLFFENSLNIVDIS